MRRWPAALLLWLTASGIASAALPSIARYEERLVVEGDGRVQVQVSIEAAPAGPAVLRVAAVDIDPASLSTSPAGAALAQWDAERRQIEIRPAAPGGWPSPVVVRFDLAASALDRSGQLAVARTITNLADARIADCSVTVVLPRGYAFTSIETHDAGDRTDTGALTAEGDRHVLRLAGPIDQPGGRMSVRAGAVRRHPPLWLPWAALALSAAYVVRFRDLARRPA